MRDLLAQAEQISAARSDTVRLSLRLIDHTSLTGAERAEDIMRLCAQAREGGAAAVCVYPAYVETAKAALKGSGVRLAAVNNFPHGDALSGEAAAQALSAIRAGADEIDTVIDYAAFLRGDIGATREKLEAVSTACKMEGALLKIIVKASVHPDEGSLRAAAQLAIACGADFVKTCTGKTSLPGYGTGAPDVSTLETAAIAMQAVADSSKRIGVKISGGVKMALDCERMRFLVDNILGPDYFGDQGLFRFGASSLLSVLLDKKGMPGTRQDY